MCDSETQTLNPEPTLPRLLGPHFRWSIRRQSDNFGLERVVYMHFTLFEHTISNW
jgi:hypothetical protein